MLIECKICGELCKDDIGLRNHVTGKKDHPSIAEYREKYINNPQSRIMMDYIIPVANINNDGFNHRLKNLNSILRVIPDFVNVIIVEQMINPIYKLYSNNLDQLSTDLNLMKKLVRFHTFNKGWLNNIGVRNSKTNNIILAEGDININRQYFIGLKDFILKNKYKWFFAWNKIIYWDETLSKKLRVDSPRKGMAEGGLVYFDKDFYWNIGGSNEFFQELGGIDNELATRARFASNEDKSFEGTINHMWHPVSNLKKEKWKLGKHHLTNRTIYYQVRNNPNLAIGMLRNMKPGNDKSPINEICRNEFFNALDIKSDICKKGVR